MNHDLIDGLSKILTVSRNFSVSKIDRNEAKS